MTPTSTRRYLQQAPTGVGACLALDRRPPAGTDNGPKPFRRDIVKRASIALAALLSAVGAGTAPPELDGIANGIAPQEPYRWVSPPPQLAADNKAPLSAHHTVAIRGAVGPGVASTPDGQATLSFVAGAFAAPASASELIVDIKPVSSFPEPVGFKPATNVYLIAASPPLLKAAVVTLRYSDLLSAPRSVYFAEQGSTSWSPLSATNSLTVYTLSAPTDKLGYFVAGDPLAALPTTSARGRVPTLPIVAALGLLIVLLAAAPLMVLKRRGESDED